MTDLDRIVQAVGSEYGQQRHALLSPSRGRAQTAFARQVAMALVLALNPRESMSAVGRAFGRDRTTVRHARDTIAALTGAEARRYKKLEKRLARTAPPV